MTRVLVQTIKEAPILPSVPSILTGNGFIVEHGSAKYICTTAHLFFAEHQTPTEHGDPQSGIMQNTVTVQVGGGTNDPIDPAEVYYSRSLDVAFIPYSGTEPALQMTPGIPGKSSFILYSDPMTRTDQMLEGKYIELVQGQVPTCAVTTEAMPGSSGSPVMDGDNNVVAMVSALSGSYPNMTMCVPEATISAMLSRIAFAASKNLDESEIFLGIFTQKVEPLVSMYASSPDDELQTLLANGGGERIVYADPSTQLHPWDIITKINNVDLRAGTSILGQVLAASGTDPVELEVYRLTDYYRKRLLEVSTTAYCTKKKSDVYTEENPDFVYEVLSEIVVEAFVEEGNLNVGYQLYQGVDDDVNDHTSLLYVGQQLQYTKLSEEEKFKKFDRAYTTIVDVSVNSNTETILTLSTPLQEGETYLVAIIPLGIPGMTFYKSPTVYTSGGDSKHNTEQFPSSTIAIDSVFLAKTKSYLTAEHLYSRYTDDEIVPLGSANYVCVYKCTITDADWKIDTHNIAVLQAFLYVLFLLINQIICSEQERINIIETEILRMYAKVLSTYNDNEETVVALFLRTYLHWLFLTPCLEHFGNNCVQMFSSIPEPPFDIPQTYKDAFGFTSWEEIKQAFMGTLYTQPLSTFAQTMQQGSSESYKNAFNTSLKNTENGFFYGTVSDRNGRNIDETEGLNLPQQLSMILEDLLPLDSTPRPVSNLTMVDYIMEQTQVSWNNLLLAHNWRKRHGLNSKMVFEKVVEDQPAA